MWILLLEAGVALFLLIFIVWWTMSGKKPDQPVQPQDLSSKQGDAPPNSNQSHD